METENNEEEYVPLYCDWCDNEDNRDEDGNDTREEVDHRHNTEFICEECRRHSYDVCYNCDAVLNVSYDSSDDVYYYNSDAWCYNCRSDYLIYCEECDDLHHEEDGICGHHSHRVRGYSKTIPMRFYISKDNVSQSETAKTLFMGTELEIMVRQDASYDEVAEIAYKSFNEFSVELKEDGSLYSCSEYSGGIEIVTQPMTLDYYRHVFPLNKLLDLRNAGARSADTKRCGMHVHVNRGFFQDRPTSMYRFMSMFHHNNEQWKIIAGRGSVEHCSWENDEKENMIEYFRYAATRGITGMQCNLPRYVPINLQNRSTIELRFFNGSMHPKVVLARLEAVDAVAKYSVSTKYSINIKKSHDWGTFRRWAEDNGYEAFSAYATKKEV